MQSHFNTASLAKFSRSQLYMLLAQYRSRLAKNGEANLKAANQAQIKTIQNTLTAKFGPR